MSDQEKFPPFDEHPASYPVEIIKDGEPTKHTRHVILTRAEYEELRAGWLEHRASDRYTQAKREADSDD